MVDETTETLADLPPSAKLVYLVLRYDGPMSQQALSEASLLSPRTVRYAINRLEAIDRITERTHIRDARQRIYELTPVDGASETEHRGAVLAADD